MMGDGEEDGSNVTRVRQLLGGDVEKNGFHRFD